MRLETEEERRLRLAAEILANWSDADIDHMALLLAQAYLSGKTPQQAAVDSAEYIGQCAPIPDPIPDAGPTAADVRGEVDHGP